jgi:hypothetical protein
VSRQQAVCRSALVLALAGALAPSGCKNGALAPSGPEAASQPAAARRVPAPLDLLLPKAIRIHPFTAMRVLEEAGGVTGVDARVEALDGYGDSGKAFGKFRFELYSFRPNNPDPKGERLGVWSADVEKPRVNRDHWNKVHRTYQFKLRWGQPIPAGQRFVLLAVFESRFTGRLFDERVFIAGP